MTDPPDISNASLTFMSAEKNAQIAKGLRQGDRAAWEEMYDYFSQDLWRYVSRLIGPDKEAIAEVVQEVFFAAAKSAGNYDERLGTLWTWLTGIAHRQTAVWYRRQARHLRIHSEETRQRLQRQSRDHSEPSSPVSLLEKTELRDAVRATLAELSVEYAMLLSAKYMDRLSVAEIQLRCGGTSDSIRSKLRRARAEFRRLFEKLDEEDHNR